MKPLLFASCTLCLSLYARMPISAAAMIVLVSWGMFGIVEYGESEPPERKPTRYIRIGGNNVPIY